MDRVTENIDSGFIDDLTLRKAYNRLVSYEVIGLTPEEIITLKAENERLKAENAEWKSITSIFDEREYRSRFLEEWRKEEQAELDKEGKGRFAGYPDGDYVYKKYYELKAENERLKAEITDREDVSIQQLKAEAQAALEKMGGE